MSKKTWGIILIVLGVLGLAGGLMNGSVLAMGVIPLIGYLAGAAILFYFGIKLMNQGKK